jgi:hypothetical protein
MGLFAPVDFVSLLLFLPARRSVRAAGTKYFFAPVNQRTAANWTSFHVFSSGML